MRMIDGQIANLERENKQLKHLLAESEKKYQDFVHEAAQQGINQSANVLNAILAAKEKEH